MAAVEPECSSEWPLFWLSKEIIIIIIIVIMIALARQEIGYGNSDFFGLVLLPLTSCKQMAWLCEPARQHSSLISLQLNVD